MQVSISRSRPTTSPKVKEQALKANPGCRVSLVEPWAGRGSNQRSCRLWGGYRVPTFSQTRTSDFGGTSSHGWGGLPVFRSLSLSLSLSLFPFSFAPFRPFGAFFLVALPSLQRPSGTSTGGSEPRSAFSSALSSAQVSMARSPSPQKYNP